MARHFKEDESGSTARMPTVRRRSQGSRQRIPTDPYERESDYPYGEGATYRYAYPQSVPGRDIDWGDVPARGGIARPVRGLLLLLAWAFRLAALLAAALVLANVVSLPVAQRTVAEITDALCSYLPWSRFGALVVDTPFSGVFRGDIALLSLGLFVIDWVLCRLRAALR